MSSEPKAKSKRGRPPVDADATPTRINLTLSAHLYDALFQRAQAKALSIPEVIRRTLNFRDK